MHHNEYQALAKRTLTAEARLEIMAMGLAGEAGELIDMLKKNLGHGHSLDFVKVRKEIGDVLWYLNAIATMLKIDMDDVAQENIDKIVARYPEGFSHEASRNRSEYKEDCSSCMGTGYFPDDLADLGRKANRVICALCAGTGSLS